MKKIICLLLALTCCVAFFSCDKEDVTLGAYLAAVNASEPTNITTLTNHTRADVSYTGMYETEMTKDGFVFTYEYEEKAPITLDGTGSVTTKAGEIVYDGKQYIVNGEPTSVAPDVAYMSLTLNLTADNIGEYKVSRDGNTLTAEISAEQVKAIFGTEISATAATLSLSIAGGRLSRVKLAYVTADNTDVYIETSYTYAPIAADAE